MQTVASLAERLDMTAEEAVEKLRYMLFEVDGIESIISDEQCDILIDVDENPDIAEQLRQDKLKAEERIRKRTERLRAAAKKAAEKRKADAKKKAEAKKKKQAEAEAAAVEQAAAENVEAAPAAEAGEAAAPAGEGAPAAEILPAAEERPVPVAEIIPAEKVTPAEETAPAAEAPEAGTEQPALTDAEKDAAAAEKKAKPKDKEKEAKKPSIVIGAAVETPAKYVEVVRADGTHLDIPDAEALVEQPDAEAKEAEEEDQGLLAEVERRQEEEELRKARQAQRSTVRPDPAVVAEVKRRAAERARRKQTVKTGPAGTASTRATGKTARKKLKKQEKARAVETMRRDAAAAIREVLSGGGKKRKRRRSRDDAAATATVETTDRPQVVEMEDAITVEELAKQLDTSVNDIILELMDLDILATKNHTLSYDVVRRLAAIMDFEVKTIIPEEDEVFAEEPDNPADLVPRAPVITVMGHVDHGKTTFLDYVRKSNVAEGEVGGITQHIAAYEVKVGAGKAVFLDTPGHEAFTQMRARGAQATDLVVLVVAADDGVMPQTIEAIDHARAADVPIVVAVNKIDKPEAQPERIRQELTRFELVDEKWGGKTIIKDISAKGGQGVDELIELLVLEAEMLELKSNPKKRARGVIIESEISKGQGPVAWVLVQNGTLRVGDVFLAGTAHGRVRSMMNSRGETVEAAGPSTPVLVMGFNSPPDAGDQFVVVRDDRIARTIAEKREDLSRQKQDRARHVTLEDFHTMLLAGEKHELNVVLKADVQGSVDVLRSNLAKLGNEEVRVHLVHTGVGGINESDVLLASASDAVVLGFHVVANPRAQKLAETEGVDIRTYQIIYELTDDVRKALEGMLAPDTQEVVTGHAEIRKVFRSSAVGNIAGCYVTDGVIDRGCKARLLRDDVVIYEGQLATLRREKDDVRNVASGFECGIKLQNFEDIKEGDVVEAFRVEEVAKTLA